MKPISKLCLLSVGSTSRKSVSSHLVLVQSDRQRWLQLAGQRLDPASYILARHELTGAAVVVFKKG